MVPKFLGCNRGTISIKRIIWDWTWQLTTLGSSLQARSSGTSYLSNTALAQTHRSSSMASSWLNFFERKKARKKKNNSKNWASYVTLSWRTNVRASKRILAMYWPGSWRIGEPAQGHVAGSISARFFFFFFSLKKLSQLRGAEPATRRWASYVALSQLRGTEPATWHWASKVALSFELARRQWASKVALSFIIYIYIYLCNPNHIIY